MIKLGSNSIGKIYLGSNSIGKAYLGSNLVFQKGGSPIPPQPILPTGYTELAYVATDSNAYIDTGVAGATDLEITTKFYVGSYVQYGIIYGNYVDESHKANRAILASSTSMYVGGGNNISTQVSGLALNAIHTLSVSGTSAVMDGVSTSISSASLTDNTTNICLGNRNVSSPVSRDIGLRIYSFEIKKNGTTVLNLVPAMRDSDDAVGFYDLVSETFMKSTTGTEFTAPPVFNYTPVSYIQTDGTAYIDTGIKGDYPKSMEMKIVPVAPSSTMALLGSKGSSNESLFSVAGQYGDSGTNANYLYFSYGVIIANGLPATSSITNHAPVVVRSSLGPPTATFAIKQYDESSFTEITFSTSRQIVTNLNMFLFARNNGGTADQIAASGTMLNYCKIYGALDLGGGLLFDGIPCYYNGEYGVFDRVSWTFKGNIAGSGAFSGPQI